MRSPINADAGRRLGGVFAVVAALLALVATPAGAAFSEPVDLDTPGCCPQVASDASGNAVAVWTHSDAGGVRALVRTVSAAGVLGPLKPLSGADAAGTPDPQIAIDADGDAIAIFVRGGTTSRVKARRFTSAGVLQAPLTLSPAGGDAANPEIASDSQGDALAVWERFDGSNWRTQARTISRNGALGPVLNLSSAGQDAHEPKVAIDTDGDALAVWERFDGSNWRTQARAISRNGALGSTKNLSAAGKDGYAAQVASDGQGDTVAVWASTLDREDFSGQIIQGRLISRNGVLGPIKGLSTGGRAAEPQITSDADGDSIAIWSALAPNFDPEVAIRVRAISRNGELGPIKELDAGPAELSLVEPQISSDADGDAVAVWHSHYFGFCEGTGDVVARTISSAGGLGPRKTLSRQGVIGGEEFCVFDSRSPQVASGSNGDVVAVWQREDFEESFGTIQMSQGP